MKDTYTFTYILQKKTTEMCVRRLPVIVYLNFKPDKTYYILDLLKSNIFPMVHN